MTKVKELKPAKAVKEVKVKVTKAVEPEITTTKAEMDKLLAEKRALDAKVAAYKKLFRAQHNITGRNIIKEIIELHKKGLTKQQIIEKGYNKGTVQRQVTLFVKGKKQEKTTIRQYLTEDTKK